jgi:pimeloyl-ACP methyl ester carboxylesterase
LSRLLLVPGIGLGPEAWQPTLDHLGDPAAPRVVTLPGYGVPADEHDDLRPAALAERLYPLIDQHREQGGGPVALVGHSASCQVVVHAARARPDRVRGLVLVGPTTDPRASTWPRLAARWLATARREDPRQVPALARQYHRTGLGSMRRAMDAARHDRIDVALRTTTCDVLVLRGPHDRICPASWAGELTGGRTSRAGHHAVTLARGGHMVPLTQGAAVAGQLLAFLSRVDGSSAPPNRPALPDDGGGRAGR